MPSNRKHHFRTITTQWWDFTPLLDWGDPALDDIGAAGFSLLPRRMNAPTLEHARTFLTVRFLSPSLGKALANEAMVVAPAAGDLPPESTQSAARDWEILHIRSGAVLHGTRSHQSRHGGLEMHLHCRLHREQPALAWHLEVVNQGRVPLRVESATLLRVGPPRKVSKHRRSDFLPTRFRLFKLTRAPKTQSAYYDLTERFGSLRLHALDALPFTVQEAPQPSAFARALPLPEGLTPATYAALLTPEDNAGLALVVGPAAFPARFELKVNTDPLAPGLTLRLFPTGDLLIPPGESLTLPPTALAWVAANDPARRALRHP